MAKTVVYQITDYRVNAGQVLTPYVVPASLLAGRTTATLTLTVDDPTADPPTDAKLMVTIDASDDGGAVWSVVSSSWGGMSGVIVVAVPIRDRRLRVSGYADQAAVIDVLVEVA